MKCLLRFSLPGLVLLLMLICLMVSAGAESNIDAAGIEEANLETSIDIVSPLDLADMAGRVQEHQFSRMPKAPSWKNPDIRFSGHGATDSVNGNSACDYTQNIVDGDLVVTNGETVEIKNEEVTIDGDIIVNDSSKLVLRNSELTVDASYFYEHKVNVIGSSLILQNSSIKTPLLPGTTVPATVIIDLQASQFVMDNSNTNLKPSLGGGVAKIDSSEVANTFYYKFYRFQRQGYGHYADLTVANSSNLQDLAVTFGGQLKRQAGFTESLSIKGMKPGLTDHFTLNTQEGAELSVKNSTVRGWIVERGLYTNKHVTVKNSTLTGLWLNFGSNENTIVKDLGTGHFSNWSSSENIKGNDNYGISLLNTTVPPTECKGHEKGDLKLLFRGSGTAKNVSGGAIGVYNRDINVTVENSSISWGIRVRGDNSTTTLQDSVLTRCGFFLQGQNFRGESHLVKFSNFTMKKDAGEISVSSDYNKLKGTAKINIPIEKVRWNRGTVVREYPVLVGDQSDQPLRNIRLKLVDPNGVTQASKITDENGSSAFSISFNKNNYHKQWTIVAQTKTGQERENVEFVTDTPILLELNPYFSISNINVTPGTINLGEPAIVSVDVSNEGEVAGTFKGDLRLDGELVKTKNVTISPNQSKTLSFEVLRNTEGQYTVSIGNHKEKLHIVDNAKNTTMDKGTDQKTTSLRTTSKEAVNISTQESKTTEMDTGTDQKTATSQITTKERVNISTQVSQTTRTDLPGFSGILGICSIFVVLFLVLLRNKQI